MLGYGSNESSWTLISYLFAWRKTRTEFIFGSSCRHCSLSHVLLDYLLTANDARFLANHASFVGFGQILLQHTSYKPSFRHDYRETVVKDRDGHFQVRLLLRNLHRLDQHYDYLWDLGPSSLFRSIARADR